MGKKGITMEATLQVKTRMVGGMWRVYCKTCKVFSTVESLDMPVYQNNKVVGRCGKCDVCGEGAAVSKKLEAGEKVEETGTTPNQKELLRRVVRGFTLRDILGVLMEEHGGREVQAKVKEVGWTWP